MPTHRLPEVRLLALLLALPIAEMWVLIKVGSSIGAFSTIFLAIITAVMGVILLRQQGLDALTRVNQRLARGELPAVEVLESVVLAIGGVLLLVPGFITDGVGFLCLIPSLRGYIIRRLLERNIVNVSQYGGQHIHIHHTSESHQDHQVIEGESKRK